MAYVITCGDEGVQINEGTRLGILGAGFKMTGFPQVAKALKKLLGKDIMVVASAENEWVKNHLELSDWEQTDASMQQQIEALADENELAYAGFTPFADPKQLKHGIKGHMVRPKGIHIANNICFTLAGGEQTYHLGHYVISAEWVSSVDKKLAKEFITTQVEFYKKQAKMDLDFVFETDGELGKDMAEKNQKVLESFGFMAS
ncbi:MAG: hypothetical protein HN846_03305 [Candidatus Pacebacteria bacterium]|jgi:hypothetical protein|nr:hypothetical protein [Candidatus Paceibacterota bacterium]MBT3511819.1 hypothetical protein [Candidatus Paceibacterota bacterium]MBT4004611.1 hypothetical protein [Candidatus Paceibacterota bacterium]MBT4358339.1 hypothetical protein [Candidatus Paceibacterota bacterium]MBT4681387.1 hypothetical protein [Candidatus Paceibacterota bacterium]